MRIAVIGTGNVGRVLGRRWSEAGHHVCFGSRRPEDEDVKALAKRAGAEAASQQDAAADAEVVLLAVPGSEVEQVVRGLGDLRGKVIVDCTNRHEADLTPRPDILSLAERIAEQAPDARVVKAFNTTGSKNMDDPAFPSGPLAMPYCGDDPEAKATVRQLISVLGFEAVDNGPLYMANSLEGMALMWIALAYGQGWGPDFGFAVLTR